LNHRPHNKSQSILPPDHGYKIVYNLTLSLYNLYFWVLYYKKKYYGPLKF